MIVEKCETVIGTLKKIAELKKEIGSIEQDLAQNTNGYYSRRLQSSRLSNTIRVSLPFDWKTRLSLAKQDEVLIVWNKNDTLTIIPIKHEVTEVT